MLCIKVHSPCFVMDRRKTCKSRRCTFSPSICKTYGKKKKKRGKYKILQGGNQYCHLGSCRVPTVHERLTAGQKSEEHFHASPSILAFM